MLKMNESITAIGDQPLRVAVFGASGYTGFELVQLVRKHPRLKLVAATAESNAGKQLSDIYPTTLDITLMSSTDVDPDGIDVAFLCLPHGPSQGQARWEAARLVQHNPHIRIIDVGGDFRLNRPQECELWYGAPVAPQELRQQFLYSIPEIHRETLSDHQGHIANPGCYPTCNTLGLFPLLKSGCPFRGTLILDSKSGVSGAGRKPQVNTLFTEVNENVTPYNVGFKHRHAPEMAQAFEGVSGRAVEFVFSPQLIPVNRGIISTIYIPDCSLSLAEAHALYSEIYARETFVKVLPLSQTASLKHVQHTNQCVISLHGHKNMLIIVSVIDNLLKGAVGQALQNLNLMFGFPETMGLPL